MQKWSGTIECTSLTHKWNSTKDEYDIEKENINSIYIDSITLNSKCSVIISKFE